MAEAWYVRPTLVVVRTRRRAAERRRTVLIIISCLALASAKNELINEHHVPSGFPNAGAVLQNSVHLDLGVSLSRWNSGRTPEFRKNYLLLCRIHTLSMTGFGGHAGAAAGLMRGVVGKRRLRHRNHHQRQALLSGADFLATISPMKRILCLCPVLTSPDKADAALVDDGYQFYRIGMAVSDPYLAYATPIEVTYDTRNSEEQASNGLYVYRGIGSVNKVAHPTYWKGMAPNKEEFLKQIGYSDIGGIAFGRPLRMRQTRTTQLDEEKIDDARRSLQCVMNNFTDRVHPSETGRDSDSASTTRVRPSEFNLQCFIDGMLTCDEALELAELEPDMWETVDLEALLDQGSSDDVQEISPSIQAASVLNSFLPGWKNTFA